MRLAPMTYSSLTDAPRADAATNYVDYWAVRLGPCKLLSLFGYNSGAQQFMQIFDGPLGPALNIASRNTFATLTLNGGGPHYLRSFDRVQLPNLFAGIAAGIYYVLNKDNATFSLYDTLAHAQAQGATGLQTAAATATGTLNLIPTHTFVVGAANNYSMIIPESGLGLGVGLSVANSTTGPLYTAGAKDQAFMLTVDNL